MKLLARSSLKKPFVKTVASVAMLGGAAAGCTGSDADIIGNPPPKTTSCPETKPTSDDACNLPAGTSCDYDDCYGSPSTKASCENGTWSFSTRSCNPPEPSCPEAEPTDGSACSGAFECTYGDCYGVPTTTASCKDGAWELARRTCNPPPPTCPEAKPADDSDCAAELFGIECTYDDCYGTPSTTATCKEGHWDVATVSCNPPPPPTCPETKPVDGTACTSEDGSAASYQCTYDDCNGTPSTTATCKDGTWNVVTMSCNPPPPSD